MLMKDKIMTSPCRKKHKTKKDKFIFFYYFRFKLSLMRRFDLIEFLMNPKKWWLPLLVIFTVSIAGVTMIGVHTYTEAPPLPNFITNSGKVIYSKADILKGAESIART